MAGRTRAALIEHAGGLGDVDEEVRVRAFVLGQVCYVVPAGRGKWERLRGNGASGNRQVGHVARMEK